MDTRTRLPALHPQLEVYAGLLAEWQQKMNLVAPSTLPDVWDRHFRDSLQLVPFIAALNPTTIADLGSGAGFPGLCLALALPDVQITLIESITKKCTFLEAVRDDLGLRNVRILNKRAEAVVPEKFDVITARAVASIDVLLGLAYPLLAPHGTALFLKGKTFEAEIQTAMQAWQFDWRAHVSETSPEGRILQLTSIRQRVNDTPSKPREKPTSKPIRRRAQKV